MRFAAFDEAGARKTGAKLGGVELMLGREILHAAPAVLAEDDNRHGFERRSFRKLLREKWNSGSLNGNTKKEDANSDGVHSTLLKHLVFSCRTGAARASSSAKRSIKLNRPRILSMRKQKGRIPAEVLFGEMVHVSHQIRSAGGATGRQLERYTASMFRGWRGTAGFRNTALMRQAPIAWHGARLARRLPRLPGLSTPGRGRHVDLPPRDGPTRTRDGQCLHRAPGAFLERRGHYLKHYAGGRGPRSHGTP